MPEIEKKTPIRENFVEFRCAVCRKILFEADAESTGVIRKKCERCKQMRTIRLHAAHKSYSILDEAAPKAA